MILAINRGSSSIKFAVYPESLEAPELSGSLDRIGTPGGVFRAWDSKHSPLVDQKLELPGHEAALTRLVDWLRSRVG